jgi:hypothetical protein
MHPDGQSFRYEYDGLDRPTYLKEGATAASPVLTLDKYDDHARLHGRLAAGSTWTSKFDYDTLSRIDQITLAPADANYAVVQTAASATTTTTATSPATRTAPMATTPRIA